jgi:hypothetical protein
VPFHRPPGPVSRLPSPLAVTRRLDTRLSARFLSYSGILLESRRGKHKLHCAASETGLPGLDSREGCVEQEADGSWVTGRRADAALGFSRRSRAGGVTIARSGARSGQSLDRAQTTARIKQVHSRRQISPGSRFQAGFACALNGRRKRAVKG